MSLRVLDVCTSIVIAFIAVIAFYGVWTWEDYYFDVFHLTETKDIARVSFIGTVLGKTFQNCVLSFYFFSSTI